MLSRRAVLAGTGAAGLLARTARADTPGTITIGVLNDMTGPLSGDGGPGSVVCVRQAVAEFTPPGTTVRVLTADHQNKTDIGTAIARHWYDQEGVDLIVDVPISSISFGIATLAREKNKVFITSGSGSTDLTGSQCTPNTMQWSYDTYMLSKSVGTQVTRNGGTKWFFITADYVFGYQLQRDTAQFVQAAGGSVMGSVNYPYPSSGDFSSFLLQAQASGANVMAIVGNGADLVNCIKQAHEFGLNQTMKIAAPLATINNIHEIGPAQSAGILLTETFYWDLNDRTRAFAKRVWPQMPNGHPPNMLQAGCYSATAHYLKTIGGMDAAARHDGAGVVAAMKRLPCDDDAFGPGSVRVDGRTLYPAYLFEAKAPPDVADPWQCYRLVATTPANEAWPPLGRGCKLAPA